MHGPKQALQEWHANLPVSGSLHMHYGLRGKSASKLLACCSLPSVQISKSGMMKADTKLVAMLAWAC